MFLFMFKASFYMKTSNNMGPQIGRERHCFGRELIFVLNTLKKLFFDDNQCENSVRIDQYLNKDRGVCNKTNFLRFDSSKTAICRFLG